MNQMNKLVKAAAVAFAATSLAAGAATYTWTGGAGNLGAGGTGGTSAPIQTMTFTYNENTQDLSVMAKWLTTGANGAPEGAWLVLSDGAMPKAAPYEVPIYYIDWANGVNRVSAAQYDGTVTNGGTGSFGSWDNKITVTDTTGARQINFTLNLAGINAYDPNGATPGQGAWTGGDFASNVGVWFHWYDQNATTKTSYTGTAGNYSVSNLPMNTESWYDTGACGNKTTQTGTATGGQAGTNAGGSTCNPTGGTGGTGGKVPVPGLAYLLGLGLVGLGLRARKQA